MSLRVFALRHSETDWSRERRFAGWRDIPPSEAGRHQSEAAAQALSTADIAAVYASPLERARTCAEAIAKPHRLEVQIAPAFKEIGLGAWEGLTRGEVEARFPDQYAVWRDTPAEFVAPRGEALAAVATRVAAGIEALRGAHEGGSIVLVTHAVVMRLIVLRALGLGPERLWSIDASPAGISELEYRENDWVTVHRMNTLAHLAPEAGV